MIFERSILHTAIVALAGAATAASLILFAGQAHSEPKLGLDGSGTGIEGSAAAGPSGILPPPTRGTKPYRKAKHGVCAESFCIYAFGKVANKKSLEIQNVSCLASAPDTNLSRFAILSTTDDFAATGLVSTLPSGQIISSQASYVMVVNSPGPYFIRGGEEVYILTGGTVGRCAISGYISRTD